MRFALILEIEENKIAAKWDASFRNELLARFRDCQNRGAVSGHRPHVPSRASILQEMQPIFWQFVKSAKRLYSTCALKVTAPWVARTSTSQMLEELDLIATVIAALLMNTRGRIPLRDLDRQKRNLPQLTYLYRRHPRPLPHSQLAPLRFGEGLG